MHVVEEIVLLGQEDQSLPEGHWTDPTQGLKLLRDRRIDRPNRLQPSPPPILPAHQPTPLVLPASKIFGV